MKPKIILITGSSDGMGKAAAIALAKQGHYIIIHGRNEAQTQQVQKHIIAESGNPKIDYLIADLSLMHQVRKMAEKFKSKYDRLDVLLNNAGAMMGKERAQTTEGIEKTIALNLLAPFLLSSLLLDWLYKSDQARIVNVASSAHRSLANPDFCDLECISGYTPNRAYGNAKLFLIMASEVMDQKIRERNLGKITINTLHPAVVVNKSMAANLEQKGLLGKIIMAVMRMLTKTPQQGAETAIYLASSDKVKEISGLYFVDKKPVKVDSKHISEETKNIIWYFCENKTGIINLFG